MLHIYINDLAPQEAKAALMRCCGSQRWAQRMVLARPFASEAGVYKCAQELWGALSKEDFLEAFSHHPQIGASREALEKKFPATQDWSAQEQSGMQEAQADIIERLVVGNRQYLEKFGYIFIVCASGKSAEEMCLLLEERLPNSPDIELNIAAAEQAKITALRLEKLI